jgi:hypothetical protein
VVDQQQFKGSFNILEGQVNRNKSEMVGGDDARRQSMEYDSNMSDSDEEN